MIDVHAVDIFETTNWMWKQNGEWVRVRVREEVCYKNGKRSKI